MLVLFVAREGHARVPQNHIEQGVGLGAWVANIRNRRHLLSADEVSRFEKLNFLWRVPKGERYLSVSAMKKKR